MEISFFVPGIPATAGSKSGFVNPKNGRVIITESCKKSKPWRERVVSCARDAYDGPPVFGPVCLEVLFRLPRPKCHYGTGKKATVLKERAPYWHTNKPDRTKMLRALEDALTGILWRDDTQVVDGRVGKVYSDTPGALVTIREIEPEAKT
jgi:Holliday junction resolvase RusA-like endonuclease